MPHQSIQCLMLLITSSYQCASLYIHIYICRSIRATRRIPSHSAKYSTSLISVVILSLRRKAMSTRLRSYMPLVFRIYTTRRNTSVTLVCRPASSYGLFIVALIWLPMPNLCRAAAPMLSCERHIGKLSQLSRENKTRATLGVYEEEHGYIVR